MRERRARYLVARRSGWICELCGHNAATNFHHRQNASQGGEWRPSNGLHLCGSGTTGCHGRITRNPRSSYEHGWSVHSWGDPRQEPVFLWQYGWVYLDDHGRYLSSTKEVPCRKPD